MIVNSALHTGRHRICEFTALFQIGLRQNLAVRVDKNCAGASPCTVYDPTIHLTGVPPGYQSGRLRRQGYPPLKLPRFAGYCPRVLDGSSSIPARPVLMMIHPILRLKITDWMEPYSLCIQCLLLSISLHNSVFIGF